MPVGRKGWKSHLYQRTVGRGFPDNTSGSLRPVDSFWYEYSPTGHHRNSHQHHHLSGQERSFPWREWNGEKHPYAPLEAEHPWSNLAERRQSYSADSRRGTLDLWKSLERKDTLLQERETPPCCLRPSGSSSLQQDSQAPHGSGIRCHPSFLSA